MSTRSLGRLAVCLALFAGLALVAGCAKTKEETKVTKEGKGTTTLTTSIDMSKMQALKEMMEGMGMGGGEGGGGSDPLEDLEPEKYKKKFEGKEGVKLVSVNRTVDEEKMITKVVAVIEFDSLEALYKSGVVEGLEVSLEKNGDGTYTLKRAMGGNMAPDADDPEAMAMAEAMLGMFEPFMNEMELSATMAFPTAITETNGAKGDDGKQVTWSVGFNDLTKPEKRSQSVTFSGEGLTWKPFSTKAQTLEADVPEEEEEEEEEELEPVMPER